MSGPAGRIDWEAVKARLAAGEGPADRREAVYRQRAAELAARRDPRERTAAGAYLDVLVFTLAGGLYALRLADLASVLPGTGVTPVPGGPSELLGVFPHQGRICSLLDLARLLGLPPADEPAGLVLLAHRPGGAIGLKVGSVQGVRRLPAGELRPAPEAAGGAAHVEGLAADGLALLSLAALLRHPVFQGDLSS